MLAAITPCNPPKCSSSRRLRVGPTAEMSSRREAVRALRTGGVPVLGVATVAATARVRSR